MVDNWKPFELKKPRILLAARVRAHGGAATQVQAGLDANRILRLPNQPLWNWTFFQPEAETSEIIFKPIEKKNLLVTLCK